MPALTHASTQKKVEREIRPYRLLDGQHIECDPRIPRNEGETDEEYKVRTETKYFRTEIVYSRVPWDKMWPEKFVRADAFNPQGVNPFLSAPAPGETEEEFKRRMERLRTKKEDLPPAKVEAPHPPATPSKPLEQMTLKELQEYAADEEVDIGNETKRERIIAVIKAAMAK
jgi:hypothetical protein